MMMIHNGKWEISGGFNPTIKSITFNSNEGPHAESVRASYVVPTNKKYVVISAHVAFNGVTAATVVALTQASISVTDNNQKTFPICRAGLTITTLDQVVNQATHVPLYLSSGNTVQINTSDASTGGTKSYSILCVGYELDYDLSLRR